MGDVIDLAQARRERDALRELKAEQEAAELRALVEARAKLLELAEQVRRELNEEAEDESDPT